MDFASCRGQITREHAGVSSGSFSETEIAQQLGVDQSTISRDIKVLKESAQQFVYDLAKFDLAYYYKQSIDGIEEAKSHGKYTITKHNQVVRKLKF